MELSGAPDLKNKKTRLVLSALSAPVANVQSD